MEIIYNGKVKIPDNDVSYMTSLQSIIEANDNNSSLMITQTPHDYKFRLCVSSGDMVVPMIEDIISFNKIMGIFVNFSKSMKHSSTINFSIENPS